MPSSSKFYPPGAPFSNTRERTIRTPIIWHGDQLDNGIGYDTKHENSNAKPNSNPHTDNKREVE